MTAETHYILNKTNYLQEGLTVFHDRNIVVHSLNKNFAQRLVLYKDSVTDVDYLEYDWYKGELWVALMLRPAYPLTDLSDFYLGRLRKDKSLHGVRLSRGSTKIQYFSQSFEDSSTLTDLSSETPINWKKLEQGKERGYFGGETRTYKDPTSQELAFAYRLIPGNGAPLAQVAITEKFHRNSSITLDTSFTLAAKIYDSVLEEAQKLLYRERNSAELAADFCDHMQMAFSPYFPML